MTHASDLAVHISDADLLRWFAGIYARELSEDQICAYRDGAAAPFLDAIANRFGGEKHADALSAAIAGFGSGETATRRLALVFADLFLLPERDTALPIASLYSGGGLVEGAPSQRMRALLAQSGIAADNREGLPADHLSVMLELLALSKFDLGSRPVSQGILEELFHRNWLRTVGDRIRSRGASAAFYAAIHDALLVVLVGLDNKTGD